MSYTNKHPIRWIGATPDGHYAVIPNGLARDGSITARARSAAMYLWSQSDGWKTSASAIAHDLNCSRDTVVDALEELAASRWMAIHVTGRSKREYFAHPARKLTEDEHYRFTRDGLKHAENSGSDNDEPAEKTRVRKATMQKNSTPNMPKKPAASMPKKPAPKKTQEETQQEAAASRLATLVDSVLPPGISQTQRKQLAAKAAAAVEENGYDDEAVIGGLRKWLGKEDAGPGLLPHLIADAASYAARKQYAADRQGNELLDAVEQAHRMGSPVPLQRYGFVFTAPNIPREVTGADVGPFMQDAVREWIDNVVRSQAEQKVRAMAGKESDEF